MRAIFDPAQRSHQPESMLVRGVVRPSQDQVERIDRLLEGLERCGIEVDPAKDFGAGPRMAVHSLEYLRFLETAHADWVALGDASAQVIPNIHPRGREATYPEAIVGRAGWHTIDTAAPIGPGTYPAVCASANTAVTAAEAILAGADGVYALCRPSGHHASADAAGGFCFLNNVAIATERLRRGHERIAVLDVDAHHGNGTQSIFYRRADVFTTSLHADPRGFYPFYWGHPHERGAGAGHGFNLNLPLPLGSGDGPFLDALTRARDAIEAFEPSALVVALGLDAAETDPLRGLALTSEGLRCVGAAIAGLGLPTLYVQEGGYHAASLADNLAAFMHGAQGA